MYSASKYSFGELFLIEFAPPITQNADKIFIINVKHTITLNTFPKIFFPSSVCDCFNISIKIIIPQITKIQAKSNKYLHVLPALRLIKLTKISPTIKNVKAEIFKSLFLHFFHNQKIPKQKNAIGDKQNAPPIISST